jgi:NIMA (never in mitosis gene a)-related kinase
MRELFLKIQKGKYDEIPTFYSSHLSNIIRKMLQVDPKHRPFAHELLALSMIQRSSDSPTKSIYSDPLNPN